MYNSAMSLAHRIKLRAGELGFALASITTPDPPLHAEFYESWLSAGHHGPMAYLATERARRRRADPREILPGCQSIIILAMNYTQSSDPVTRGPWPVARMAAYARSRDYHDVLYPRMQALVAWLEDEVGNPIPHKLYTDTGPILERDLAQRAGLGWIGKNTCLINPRAGSYLLLSEIFLALALDPDAPFLPDHCGSCTRCLDACPTACILPDRTLDASRCISTLTIELKGPIPLDLRPQMGNWVFGCDICQDVCPWNRFAQPTTDPDFLPSSALMTRRSSPGGAGDFDHSDHFDDSDHFDYSELSLTSEQFREKFRGSPVKRAKRRGYLRNVAVALGNSGDRQAVPALASALRDEEPLIRAHAAWALGRLGGEAARAALQAASLAESDPEVLAEIRLAQKPT